MITQDEMQFMSLEELDATPDEDIPAECALAYLLLDGDVFISRPNGNETVISVSASDGFAWYSEDVVALPPSEIVSLYRSWRQDSAFGALKWVYRRRQCQPPQTIIDDMKKYGSWDEGMAALPENPSTGG